MLSPEKNKGDKAMQAIEHDRCLTLRQIRGQYDCGKSA